MGELRITLALSHISMEELANQSPLHSIRWKRIVLDEAHRIKGRTTSTAQAVYALRSTYKWALSGTPLQNRVGDLYSLIKFLRLAPFSQYKCSIKNCLCSSPVWNFGPMSRKCVG